MTPSTVVLLLAVVGCAVALPLRPERSSGPLVGVPILVQEPGEFDSRPREEPSPLAYVLLYGNLDSAEGAPGGDFVEKRSAKMAEEEEDLETAAGTYALRPLFVYRQQLAYRQRVRDAFRRRNQF